MSFFRSFVTVFSVLNFAHCGSALYDHSSKTNLALYWGQGANQQRLSHFCEQSAVDIIPIGFINVFPGQGNGYPGSNFANQCWGRPYVYPGPGPDPSEDQLQSQCPLINEDIPLCQKTHGKKIILSLGGATATYALNGTLSGVAFADFLWGAFGPQTADWLAQGLPRPFDGPNGEAVEVDGFDYDIEHPSTDGQEGYVALGLRLREHFQTASKKYILTGAPQCVIPDANMGAAIQKVKFDIIWVQFYNTPQCSARSWVAANSNYTTGDVEHGGGFTYRLWERFLIGTASADAKLYLGVPGAPDEGHFYLYPDEIANMIEAYFCRASFGGIMIWEATSAENNPDRPYFTAVKDILTGFENNTNLPCRPAVTTSTVSSMPSATANSTRGLRLWAPRKRNLLPHVSRRI